MANKCDWTMKEALKWIADHGKNISGYYEGMEETVLENIEMTIEEIEDEIKSIAEAGSVEIKGEVLETTFTEVKEYNANEIYQLVKDNKELIKIIKELELKAGAVLNAKNKKDLKNAQALIQSVLDSATTGEEEDSLEITDEKGEDDKTDITVIDLVTHTVDDPPIDEKEDESKIEVDEKIIAKTIEKHMNYLVGKLDKSDT
jgi:hypothetical protein